MSTENFAIAVKRKAEHGRHEAIHLWKDISRQMGLYTDRFSDIGCNNFPGGFEIINSGSRGADVRIPLTL